MIDENFDFEISIKYFTTSEWFIEKFKPTTMKSVLTPEEADILILDPKSLRIENQYHSSYVFCIDLPIDGCRAVISKEYIVEYFNMIDRMQSDEYFVGMADYSDVMRVSYGRLLHYGSYELDVSKDTLYADLPQELTEKNVGIIIFLSKKDCRLLKRIAEDIDLMYTNALITLMLPAQESQLTESFLEVYIFQSYVDDRL